MADESKQQPKAISLTDDEWSRIIRAVRAEHDVGFQISKKEMEAILREGQRADGESSGRWQSKAWRVEKVERVADPSFASGVFRTDLTPVFYGDDENGPVVGEILEPGEDS
jgi:hypothetical protein